MSVNSCKWQYFGAIKIGVITNTFEFLLCMPEIMAKCVTSNTYYWINGSDLEKKKYTIRHFTKRKNKRWKSKTKSMAILSMTVIAYIGFINTHTHEYTHLNRLDWMIYGPYIHSCCQSCQCVINLCVDFHYKHTRTLALALAHTWNWVICDEMC